jgi:hypothetical protein
VGLASVNCSLAISKLADGASLRKREVDFCLGELAPVESLKGVDDFLLGGRHRFTFGFS